MDRFSSVRAATGLLLADDSLVWGVDGEGEGDPLTFYLPVF